MRLAARATARIGSPQKRAAKVDTPHRSRGLLAESEGVPQRVHRAARRWARHEAAQRLSASADRAAGERARLRAAEDDLAASVVELQAADDRAEPPAHEIVACPFKGLARRGRAGGVRPRISRTHNLSRQDR